MRRCTVEKKPRRLVLKELDVLRSLREQNVGGQILRRARLRPHRQSEQQFKVSGVTVQPALHQLVSDSVDQARPQGSFVSTNPPHLSHYGLVFPYRPTDDRPWRRFWTALRNESTALEHSRAVKISTYYEVQCIHALDTDRQSLLTDVEASRLARLFLIGPAPSTFDEPFMKRPELPRAVLCMDSTHADCVSLQIDMQSFFDRAVDLLAARGRRRIAVLMVPHGPEWDIYLKNAMRKAAVTTLPCWTQMVPLDHAVYAQNVLHLMFHPDQSERPDGLIIVDDNLVEHASVGLLAAGAKVPGDLEVVAHCNHPWPTPSAIPMRRLGFDAREVMRTALTCIDRQRHEGSVPAKVIFKAMFENELSSASRK